MRDEHGRLWRQKEGWWKSNGLKFRNAKDSLRTANAMAPADYKAPEPESLAEQILRDPIQLAKLREALK
jgi:hypothetical protein